MSKLNIGSCYRIAGRRPLVLVSVAYNFERRYVDVVGFTPQRYKRYLKFFTFTSPNPTKTVAKVEGIDMPQITRLRFRYTSKIEEVAS